MYVHGSLAKILNTRGIGRSQFCGITMKNYVERKYILQIQTTLKYGLKMLSSSSETIIFMFLGVATIHDNTIGTGLCHPDHCSLQLLQNPRVSLMRHVRDHHHCCHLLPVFVQGITIKPLVKFLRVKTASDKDPP
ncbi:hypothetical protein TCAL_17167 [Tigriopus californicus]|uniref:Uncharacterized protein n=1 Tax=Tigriopus californicus TaxID=6832 RepID=A0A553N7G9_TIGCA|nr:hypothetical protein TCAL_17167 [Tigriopus californicus]